MKKTWLLMVVLLTAFALAACGEKEDSKKNSEKENSEPDHSEVDQDLPEADLDNIPDIVAEVNGEEILKENFINAYENRFQQEIMQAQMSGENADDIDQELLKEEVIDLVIGQYLLMQEASNTIKDASEEYINEAIDLLLEQRGLETKEDLLASFEEQGVNEEDFMSKIVIQAKLNQFVDDISKDIELTEDEVKDTYETLKIEQEQLDSEDEFPAFDEVESSLESQIIDQKAGEKTIDLIEELRKSADITKHL